MRVCVYLICSMDMFTYVESWAHHMIASDSWRLQNPFYNTGLVLIQGGLIHVRCSLFGPPYSTKVPRSSVFEGRLARNDVRASKPS